MTSFSGLTSSEVVSRRKQGQGNDLDTSASRSYWDIIYHNIFNPIHIIFYLIGIALVSVGQLGDALASVWLVLINAVVGTIQEMRAKRKLDQIALLTRPKVTVIRDNKQQDIDPAELVLGDVILVAPGDQIVVDGKVLADDQIEVDESLLTGESDLITKKSGEDLLSGSFCVTGQTLFEATRVGKDAYANQLTEKAKKFQVNYTPLQQQSNTIIRFMVLIAIFIGVMVLLGARISDIPEVRRVQISAVIIGLIPTGLLLMIILGYSQAAVRLAKKGALIQQSNAIESVSNVTILCTDKTGTLTTNRITYHDVYPVGFDEADLKRSLGIFAKSASTSNKTSQAISDGLVGTPQPFSDEVPFSSARKWSALSFANADKKDGALHGTYVLGAPEMLSSHLDIDTDTLQQIESRTEQGLRVLIFAGNSESTDIHDSNQEPALPQLELLGVVSLADELRPHLKEAITSFEENEVGLKIISGDNPQTVAALARQAGLPGELKAISGPELAQMNDGEFIQAVQEYSIFGRITPNQKESLVAALHEQEEYVAMIGDGVNDVLSLKKADVGIAMESGSSATRGVAKMILLGDSFGALPLAFTEGQRIVNGLKDILRLEVSRTIYLSLLMVAIPLIGLGFPFTPRQAMVFAFFATGGPTLGLSFWSHAGRVKRKSVIQEISHFIFPAGITIMIFGVGLYMLAFYLTSNKIMNVPVTPEMIADFKSYYNLAFEIQTGEQFQFEVALLAAQTTLVIFGVLAALWLVVFVQPPHKWFTGGDEYSGDWRPTFLAGGLLIAFILLMVIEPVRRLFEFVPLPPSGYLLIAFVVLVWMLFIRLIWRRRWLERFLGVDN